MLKYVKTKKHFSYELHEKAFHRIISEIIEIICLFLLFFCGFFIYDTVMIKKSAVVDKYIKEFKPIIQADTKKASLDELQAINEDIIAWITIDDTTIDYPILHNTQSYSYINLNYEGKSSLSGSLYTDVMSNRYFHDDYTIVYGHHMEGGMMLGSLDYYKDQDYLNDHLTGTLITEEKIYDLTVLSLVKTNAYDEIYKKTTMPIYESFRKDNSRYEILSGTLQNVENKLLILSTCYGGGMDRLLLIIRMEER